LFKKQSLFFKKNTLRRRYKGGENLKIWSSGLYVLQEKCLPIYDYIIQNFENLFSKDYEISKVRIDPVEPSITVRILSNNATKECFKITITEETVKMENDFICGDESHIDMSAYRQRKDSIRNDTNTTNRLKGFISLVTGGRVP